MDLELLVENFENLKIADPFFVEGFGWVGRIGFGPYITTTTAFPTAEEAQREVDHWYNKARREYRKRNFLKAGWEFSHAIADGGICGDRSCFRCRLADLLFEVENGY